MNSFPNDFYTAYIWLIGGFLRGVLGSIGLAVPNFERGDIDVGRARGELQLCLAMCGAPKQNCNCVGRLLNLKV